MNNINLSGVIRNISPSHNIGDIEYSKAELLTTRDNGQVDIIDLRFKTYCNKYKEDDNVDLTGNLRSYSYKVDDNKNKVVVYVFTYFDRREDEIESVNIVHIDGRICKMQPLRVSNNGKHSAHFILANNLISGDNGKRLNSYIPCIAWGKVAKEISKLSVSDKIEIVGELHSREHKKVHPDGEVEFRVAHELLVKEFKVVE